MDSQMNKSEIILLLEENGYSEKEIKTKDSHKRNFFVKVGCLHMIGFPYDNILDCLIVSYLIGDKYFPTRLRISTQEMNNISSVNRFVGLILEVLAEIEKDFEKEVIKNSDIAPFGVYSDMSNDPFYDLPFCHLPIEFVCNGRSSVDKTYRFLFIIYYESKSIVVKKYIIDNEYVGIFASCEV